MDWLKDWRCLILFYIVLAGVWGVVQKFASMKLNTMTLSFVSITSAALVVIIASISMKNLQFSSFKGVSTAALGGVLGGVATIAFYGALRKAPASIVVPLGSLSLVITVILAHFFLKETIGMKHMAGILFGILAIILLSR